MSIVTLEIPPLPLQKTHNPPFRGFIQKTPLSKDFKGDWKLISVWEESKIQVCQGHPLMAEMANELVVRWAATY